MATFNAEVVGSKLNYDFTSWGGSAGVIPEPSDDQITAFFEEIDSLADESDLERAEGDAEAASELVDNLDITEVNKRMISAVSGLCQGSPSETELNKLPPRARQAFIKWIMKQVQDPELETPGTKRSQRGAKGA